VVIGLLLATAWILAAGLMRPQAAPLATLPAAALVVVVMLLVWRTRLHLLWMLATGALLGAFGWV